MLDATVNLSVVPDLTAKFASTSTVPLNSDVPETVRLPPSVVLPLFTFNVPVPDMSIPNELPNVKSPAPAPSMVRLAVSVRPNLIQLLSLVDQYQPKELPRTTLLSNA